MTMTTKKPVRELLQTPKGTHDILPADMPYWERIRRLGAALATFYGFKRMETPHFEKTDLFTRTLGETSDVVEKQMYSFRTRGGDHLTLRPEITAPIVRAYIQHGMASWPQPVKLYTDGAVFRHENPQRGRFREFGQFDVEILGEDDPITDALVIRMFYTLLEELGFKNIAVQVNSMGDDESRANYRKELVAFYRKKINSLCKDCKRRLRENPLRLLDCKEESCVELKEEAPEMIKYLSEASKKRFKALLELLEEGGIPYLLNPHLVRGFDYYTETVFEVFVNCEDGSTAQPISMAGGGRYDKLVKMLGGRDTPAVGAGMGIDRLIMEMKEASMAPPAEEEPHIFLVQLGPAARKKMFGLLEHFRKAGIPIAESVGKDSIKSQLKIASKISARYTLILGQKEALEGTVILREMETGAQETIRMGDIVDIVKQRLRGQKR